MPSLLSNDPLGNVDQHLSAATLCETIEAQLSNRLRTAKEYTEDEIAAVAIHPFKLFPEGFMLDLRATGVFRNLTKFARMELRPPRTITSHRKYIGPAIVSFKKALFPLVKFLMKDAMASQSHFNDGVIKSLADQWVALDTTGSAGLQTGIPKK